MMAATGRCFILNQICCGHFPTGAMKKILFLLALVQGFLIWHYYSGKKNSQFIMFGDSSVSGHMYQSFHLSGVFHIPLTHQEDMNSLYTEISENVWCFTQGLNYISSKKDSKCICLTGWYGVDCGLPESVWSSELLLDGTRPGVWIKRRDRPRRVINGVVFTIDYDLLEIRVNELNSSVDAFLVAEQNCSTMEDDSPPPLFSKLQEGFLKKFHSKIIYVSINDISSLGFESIEDSAWEYVSQMELWKNGLKMLSDFRPDDMLIFSKMSDIPSRDVLLFFKLYDGFPEPVGFHLRTVMYNFAMLESVPSYKINSNRSEVRLMACSFTFFSSYCDYDINKLQKRKCDTNSKLLTNLQMNFKKEKYWKVGSLKTPAGWSCRWCLRPPELRKALIDQQCPNKPMGVPQVFDSLVNDNTSLAIEMFAKSGMSLDKSSFGHQVFQSENDQYYAPSYVLLNKKRFDFLLGDISERVQPVRNETVN
ncbi:beta-1,4-mannosyl-glycoprotein 4-beta-N-acetylglucosaminyltransferase-like [Tachypleus tridentatus]|uniref:beta-1,4-mannosyl-glycoprotein 4-beta-N-acetylglucosaminyltransferase-like n=1 Tax=Tachypleus tridentatus TaxID=6853 RepID=UPI003FD674F1